MPESTLANLGRGETAVISSVQMQDQACLRRLEDLGLTAGATVSKLREAPMRGTAIYRVCDYNICLRASDANCIKLEINPADGA